METTQIMPMSLLDDLIDVCKDEPNPTRKIYAKLAQVPSVHTEDYISIEIEDD